SRHAALAGVYVAQIYWIVIGFLIAMLIASIDYRHLSRLAPALYAFGLLTLALVLALGGDVRGASRWLHFGSLTFQPSELMKPLVVLMVARHVQNDAKTEARNLIDLFVPF